MHKPIFDTIRSNEDAHCLMLHGWPSIDASLKVGVVPDSHSETRKGVTFMQSILDLQVLDWSDDHDDVAGALEYLASDQCSGCQLCGGC